jgi:hypothetical protein
MTLQSSAHPTPIPRTSGRKAGIAKLKPWFGGLCLAASLGAHGVLLGLPWWPSANETEDFAALEELPLATMDVAVLPAPPAQPELDIPIAVPRPATTRPTAVDPSPRVVPPVQPSVPEVIPASAEQEADPAPPAPDPMSTHLEPEPIPEPMAEPIPEPEPQPYADFPHVQGAQQADCGGEACWTSPVEGSWRGAARSIQDNLEAQGYILNNITGEVLSTETGLRIYRVVKDGEDPYYLNLVSVNDGILYSLTPTPLSEDRLVALQSL